MLRAVPYVYITILLCLSFLSFSSVSVISLLALERGPARRNRTRSTRCNRSLCIPATTSLFWLDRRVKSRRCTRGWRWFCIGSSSGSSRSDLEGNCPTPGSVSPPKSSVFRRPRRRTRRRNRRSSRDGSRATAPGRTTSRNDSPSCCPGISNV